MITEFFIRAINESNTNQQQKNVLLGFITRSCEAEDQKRIDKDLCQHHEGKFNHIDNVVVSTDEVKIYKVKPISSKEDDWATKYPYRSIYFKDNKWNRTLTVSPTLDTALLVYLSHKHLGANSQFNDFAIKMLGIILPE